MRIRHNGSLKLRSTGEKFELMKYCTQGFLTQLYIITHNFNIYLTIYLDTGVQEIKKKICYIFLRKSDHAALS